MMAAIADHDSRKALTLLNESYAQGKDMGALLDELCCLIRDLMVIQTAPREGISLLSGVASDSDVRDLCQRFSSGELVFMMNTVQATLASFTRSASRRVDTELCILNLCQPELTLDARSLNARLSRVEEQLKNGDFAAPRKKAPAEPEEEEDELPPLPDDGDAPPDPDGPPVPMPQPPSDDTPLGFWPDLATQIRKELKPPITGFFAPTPNAPIQGVLRGDVLELRCSNPFTQEVVNKPEILALVAQKAAAMLGRNLRVCAVDASAQPRNGRNMQSLLQFGREHSDIIKIK